MPILTLTGAWPVISLGGAQQISYLHWFLTEQREEVSSMSALLAVVERASATNVLLADEYLARNPVGDQGAPEVGAPPAAGGAL